MEYDACMSATSDLLQRLLSRGLTQVAISRRTGIPQPRLSRWAAGDAANSADDALKLQQLEVDLAAGIPPDVPVPQGEGVSHGA